MSEIGNQESESSQPKRSPGRPRKNAPHVSAVVHENETNASASVDNEAAKEGEKSAFVVEEVLLGDHHRVGEKANDLATEKAAPSDDKEIAENNYAAPPGVFFIESDDDPCEDDNLACVPSQEVLVRDEGGDLPVVLKIREAYVEALAAEAKVQGVMLDVHLQRLLDWWIENEFVKAASST